MFIKVLIIDSIVDNLCNIVKEWLPCCGAALFV